ncbi:MAG TPA: pilus assembly protein TadG-related protein [Acidimicrobiales bacterium]|nr:pilus assembly protein TadG-related protein [Acidimicrobiales bacterium]
MTWLAPHRSYREERGAVLVLMALLLVVVFGCAALAIDLGNVAQTHQGAQDAADAAAISGAEQLSSWPTVSEGQIVSSVESYVHENLANVPQGNPAVWTSCPPGSIPPGFTAPSDASGNAQNCIAFNAATSPRIISVAIPPQLVSYSLGKAVGVSGVNLSATATASIGAGGTAPCALCSLGQASLQNGTINVSGNSVYVDGTLSCNPQGSITVTGAGAGIEVDAGGVTCGKGTFSPSPNWNAPFINDPLGGLPDAPSFAGLTAQPDCSGGTASPGIYNNIGSCTLNPGLYVIAGGVFGGNGNTSIAGSGVTVYFTCGTAAAPRPCASGGQQGGSINAGGRASINLSACQLSACPGGAVQNLVLWFDRNDTSQLDFHGNGQLSIVGTVYAKSATLSIKGTPAGVAGRCGTSSNFCSEIVVNSFTFSGQGTLSVSFSQNQNVLTTRPAALCTLAAADPNC